MKPANYTLRTRLLYRARWYGRPGNNVWRLPPDGQVSLEPCGSKVAGNMWQSDCQLCHCFFTTADVDCTFRLLSCQSLPK